MYSRNKLMMAVLIASIMTLNVVDASFRVALEKVEINE